MLGVRNDVPMLMISFYEGFCIVLLESQAVGLQAVIADTNPKEADMGINLVDALSLNDNIQIRADKLMAANTRIPDGRNINVLEEKSFYTTYNAKVLTEIYKAKAPLMRL